MPRIKNENEISKERPTGRRPKRVTAADVAKAAGVSRPLVSRAFTPGAYIDKEKRSHILKTALHLGYRPNALAASLQGSQSNLVGIVTGDLNNNYDSEFGAKLVAELNAVGKLPLVLGGSDDVTAQSIPSVLNYPLDALIVRGGSIGQSIIEDCGKLNIPLIFSGLVVDAPLTDCVCCRNSAGSIEAVNLLLQKGRRSFAFLGGPVDRSSSRERLEGVRERLKLADLALEAELHSDYTFEGGRAAVINLFSHKHVDAIICANDAMALGALSAARNMLDIKVPAQLSIVGFDDVAIAAWPDFDLTTLRNPLNQTVAEILRLLETRLENPTKASEVTMIDPILIKRGTH